MSGQLAGLDFVAVGERLNAAGLRGEDRARAIDLLGAIETGALKALAEAGENEEGG